MRFGVREVCNVVLKAIDAIPASKSITGKAIAKGEPVMYFDTLKVSTMTGAVSTVYAMGGQGNPRLLAWDSDKEITFNMEDALISPESFALLAGGTAVSNEETYVGTGALGGTNPGEIDLDTEATPAFVITGLTADDILTVTAEITGNPGTGVLAIGSYPVATYDFATNVVAVAAGTDEAVEITVVYSDATKKVKAHRKEIISVDTNASTTSDLIYKDSDYLVFAFKVDDFGNIVGGAIPVTTVNSSDAVTDISLADGERILIDYYTEVVSTNSLIIESNKFGGYFKLEADTLWRRESDGQDVTAQFIVPKLKIKSNFELTMEASGDPSTFSFEADAFKVSADGKQLMFKIDILEEDVNA